MRRIVGWIGCLVVAVAIGQEVFGETAAGVGEHLESHRQDRQVQAAEEAQWRARHEAHREQVAQARTRLDRAVAAYSRAQRPGRERGGARSRAAEERSAARDALTQAEAELAAFLEAARRSGVPPGWLRPMGTRSGSDPSEEGPDR